MGKKKIDKEIFKTLIEEYAIKDTNDIKDMLKDLMSGTIQTRQTRQLEDVYPIVFMDAIHYSVRKDGIVVKKAVYMAIGIDREGRKDIRLGRNILPVKHLF